MRAALVGLVALVAVCVGCLHNGQPSQVTLDDLRLGEWILAELASGRDVADLPADCARNFGTSCPADQVLIDLFTNMATAKRAGRAEAGTCR